MENLENTPNSQPSAASKSVGRRALLKSGWIIPVIAVAPLVNTASAMSAVNCDALLQERNMYRQNGDRAGFDAAQRKLDKNGCPC